MKSRTSTEATSESPPAESPPAESPPAESPPAEPPPAEPPPGRSRKIRRLLLELGVAGLLFLGLSSWQGRTLLDSTEAPMLSAVSLDGTQVDLHQLRGKNVILHFWATWCGVCRQEFGMLNRLHAELPDDTVLLTVLAETDALAARRFVEEHELRYPVVLGTESLLRAYGVGAFPTNYFIDESGVITSATVGMSTGWAMRLRAGCDL